MKKFFRFGIMFIICFLVASPVTSAEIVELEATGEYIITVSLDENILSAQETACEDAMRRIAQQAGVYVKSYAESVDNIIYIADIYSHQ